MRQAKDSIPILLLPQNFQDAVTVTRILKLRYLWIDALCIIQDDPGDWAKEAGLMDKVYTNAYLTIVATSAKTSDDGFLRREPFLVPPLRMSYSNEGDVSGQCDDYYIAYMPAASQWDWENQVYSSPWSQRAWTFQEHLLSRRVLHFTSAKVFWECRTVQTSEEMEPPRIGAAYTTLWRNIAQSVHENPISPRLPYDFDPRFSEWYNLVFR